MPKTKLELDFFDPRRIKSDKTCLFIGRRGSGKTTLVEDILYWKRRIPTGVVFSATEAGNKTWAAHFPSTFIYKGYDRDILKNVLAMQSGECEWSDSHPSYRKRPTVVILEDCLYDRTIRRDKTFRELLMNGRHFCVLALVTMQYVLDLGPDARGQFDYVFVLQNNIRMDREKLWKHWFGIVPRFELFNKMMDVCTSNRGVLVLDNTSLSNDINKNVYYYRAQIHPPYLVGCRQYWVYHYSRFKGKDKEGAEAAKKESRRARRAKFGKRGTAPDVEISIRGRPPAER